MTIAPAAAGQARRIGDILLELGFVSEEALAKANIEQEKTGAPLGQILVDHGAITRLELASALAEQWSDQSASITLLPVPPPAPRPSAPPAHHDEDQYAARLQDAVAELAQRVGASQANVDVEARVTDLAERIEATVARAQRIEATLAALADTLQGVTGGAEEALNSLQTGMAGLAIDLARVDSTLAEIVARPAEAPAEDPGVAARLDELAAAVQALAERPVPDGTVVGRVDALEGHAASLAEIRATLQELQSRPVGSPDLDARLARIETELSQRATEAPGAAEVEKLATRLEKTVDKHKSLAALVEELGSRLETVARPDDRVDRAAARVAEMEGRVEQVVQALDQVRQGLATQESIAAPQRLDELGAGLAAIREELSSLARSATPSERVDELASRLDEVAGAREAQQALATKLDDVERRLPSEVVTPAELAQALEHAREEIVAGTRVEPDPRIEQLARELESLRTTLATPAQDAELAGRLDALVVQVQQLAGGAEAVQASLIAKVDDVERRLPSDIVTLEDLSVALARVREEIVAGTQVEPDPRIDQLEYALEAIRDELAASVGHLAGDAQQQREALAAKLDDVERRLPSEVVTPADLVQALAHELEPVRAALAVPPQDAELAGRLDALVAQVEQLAGGAEAVQAGLAAKLDDVERRLPSDIVTLEDLSQALMRVREEVALESATGGPDPRIEELLNEVASLRRDHKPDERVDVLVHALESLRAELVEATARIGVPDPELDGRLQALAERVEQVAGDTDAADAVAARLEELEGRLPTEVVTPAELAQALTQARAEIVPVEPAGPDPRIDELAAGLVDLRAQLQAVPQTDSPDPALRNELATLGAKLAEVEGRLPGETITGADVARAVDELRTELAAVEAPPAAETGELEATVSRLTQRLESLEGLAARVDGLADAVATGSPSVADPAQAQMIERLEGRVEELATTLAERLAASSPGGTSSPADTDGLMEELERNRMTLERLGLHLGEHDRALAELMRSRNLPKRLDELAARVEELAAGGVAIGGGAAPAAEGEGQGRGFDRSQRALPGELAHEMKALLRRVEDAEIANSEDREKLMVRLERMASSIDWRLQRLEAPPTSE